MSRRVLAVAAVVLAALAVLAAVALAPRPSPTAAAPREALPAGVERVPLGARAYLLADVVGRPADAPPPPLVVALHGRTDRPVAFIERSGLAGWAAAGRAVVVAPATGSGLRVTSWNAGTCCDDAAGSIDDSGFLVAVVADALDRTGADPDRVAVVGFSNGAMMGYRLVCEHAELVDALVAVAGPRVLDPCTPSRPVPVLHLHGAQDDYVPVDGLSFSPSLGLSIPSARDGLSAFLDARLEVLEGMGHRWTRGDDGAPDVTALVEAFLAEQAVLPAAFAEAAPETAPTTLSAEPSG